jgi:hypothetical protein
MKKSILIYEPHCDKVPHLVFLLRLADISCTHARTAVETIDWLAAHRLKVITFDLLLISSFTQTKPEQHLLMALSGLPLPVVFLQRENTPLVDLLDQNGIICHPDDLLSCLNDCLASTTY